MQTAVGSESPVRQAPLRPFQQVDGATRGVEMGEVTNERVSGCRRGVGALPSGGELAGGCTACDGSVKEGPGETH